jgi:hypothetical protein
MWGGIGTVWPMERMTKERALACRERDGVVIVDTVIRIWFVYR